MSLGILYIRDRTFKKKMIYWISKRIFNLEFFKILKILISFGQTVEGQTKLLAVLI